VCVCTHACLKVPAYIFPLASTSTCIPSAHYPQTHYPHTHTHTHTQEASPPTTTPAAVERGMKPPPSSSQQTATATRPPTNARSTKSKWTGSSPSTHTYTTNFYDFSMVLVQSTASTCISSHREPRRGVTVYSGRHMKCSSKNSTLILPSLRLKSGQLNQDIPEYQLNVAYTFLQGKSAGSNPYSNGLAPCPRTTLQWHDENCDRRCVASTRLSAGTDTPYHYSITWYVEYLMKMIGPRTC
jgi:hypothetical protein